MTIVIVLLGLELLSLVTMPSVLLRRRGNPISATGWLVALVALPGLTWVAWWIFGRTRLQRKTRRHSAALSRFSDHQKTPSRRGANSTFQGFVSPRALESDAFFSSNNGARLLLDGHNVFPALEHDLRNAQKNIHMFFFTFQMDDTGKRILDLLVELDKKGIVVRLLLDGLGSQEGQAEIAKRLEGTGVKLGIFLPKKFALVHLPRLNFVNHRKIVVIDNQIAFTGGANVGHEYEHEWRDLMVRLDGPVAAGLNHVFLEDWYFATDELLENPAPAPVNHASGVSALVVSSGPSSEDWIHDALFAAIGSAQHRVWLTTPYLIPTAALRQALRCAAARGVDVRILIPRKSDVHIANWAARPYFRPLLRDGVRVFTYPTMVHAKTLVFDDCCSVGSANLDHRSMELSFEVCCFLDAPDLTAELAEWVQVLMRDSEELNDQKLSNMSKRAKVLESMAHLLSPLL